MSKPLVWLLSAYHTDSHAVWADWLTHHLTDWQWRLYSLPGRHFRWRIRGNPLSWLDQLPKQTPDLIVASSMVDLSTLRGLRSDLASVPCVYYFHENQFEYPCSAQQHSSIDPQMVQLYGALAADRIAFNSAFNRDSFLDGVHSLMQKLPDHCPAGLQDRLRQKSLVLPVPIEPVGQGERDPRLILWNHRWEYDKAPEVFAQAIELLQRTDTPFRLALFGARGTKPHAALRRLREQVPPAKIVADGYLPKSDYRRFLGRASIVVSSAIHEFQGLAMLEAVSAGASPLAPDALCYPEQYPVDYLYAAGNGHALFRRLKQWLESTVPEPPDISCYYGAVQLPGWQALLSGLLD